MNGKPTNKAYTWGVKRHRKWLKHLWGEGQRIVYTEKSAIEAMDNKGQPMLAAYIERTIHPKNLRPVRLVVHRMAENVWLKRRDK